MNRARALGVAALAVIVASGMATAAADPATDDRGFVDSTARCEAPATAAVFGYTASSRIAICKSPSGQYEYRGVRVADGARLITSAKPTDGGFVAENEGITYTVTSKALVVRAGGQVIRDEPMVDFHGQGPAAPAAPALPAAPAAPSTQPSAAPPVVEPTTSLPPPLPAEVGGGDGGG
jgi:hypothetical protein